MAANQTSMFHNMNRQRATGEQCDFTIKGGGKDFQVHQIVLSTASPYFRRMFESRSIFQSKTLVMKDVSADAIEACIEEMYIGNGNLNHSTVKDTLKVAYDWEIQKMVKKCESFLSSQLLLANCIEMKRQASQYGLSDLAKKCNRLLLTNIQEFISRNDIVHLDLSEMVDLLHFDENSNVELEELWKFCIRWGEEKNKQHKKSLCDIIAKFPVQGFEILSFKQYVWEYNHMKSCGQCQKTAVEEFLNALYSWKFFQLKTPQECLFLKKISRKYDFKRLEEKADEYVIKNHYQIFMCGNFVKIIGYDVSKYAKKINEECTVEEFTNIVECLKLPEPKRASRKDAFQEMFGSVTFSRFQSSLRNIQNLATERSSRPRCAIESWWPKNGLYMKNLAKEYERKEIEGKIDACIVRDFAKFSKTPEFGNLGPEDITKYLSTPELYSAGEEIVWNAIKFWINSGWLRNFPKLFQAMLLEKFSTDFLNQTVVVDDLVKENTQCLSLLTANLIQRVQRLEETVRKNDETVLKYGERLQIMENKLNVLCEESSIVHENRNQ